ncbi:MAG: hypothetical protein A2W61_06595 [Deltaproteobacteria bacterium RIFCSPLOWO2_01_44_7]|nr:MAG: hypothetical protein A2712_01240 [Deltaproteobacteria bacterium RIFCSPHIGHO2_01_FULL_43_49]OGQ15240.1 MAG: hypothetical protein A3D22_04235 [Deltaproteobacteria bacterium RIFCSPHIGHO2_02_FULL_44_53]OGQ27137.1 MAG: hypothetical protein A3D98_01830 [Deltaproteobacteria bacterium RIFCSPHIGHO2_12_FULL_44_21]OGQ31756.1 MAG: hypothetical protein A2979_05395 [Deltaproteobacteria bacterium RIFCSPLOWO2_01_FULL_45_74]OGQ42145.1 MAG: hypothetical protein A2W61_06595 [Deltaproteobacteria bacterium 
MKRLLVAIGGNAISSPERKENFVRRIKRLQRAISQFKPFIKKYRMIVTHGNGLDIGNLLIQQEKSKKQVSPLSLDSLDAMTQGQLGYWLQQTISNILKKETVAVVTRVLVDKRDRAFKNPTKPVGPFYNEHRRLVASPRPQKIIEARVIKELVKKGVLVIACGGGGIPVVKEKGKLVGIEAVIDKDLCAVKLAKLIGADLLLILTDVDSVYLNFRKRTQKRLKKLSVKEAKKYLAKGEFGEGSMKPKIEACIEFLKNGGKKCFIGSYEKVSQVIQGKSGTAILP